MDDRDFKMMNEEFNHSKPTPHKCPVCDGRGIVPPSFYYTIKGLGGVTSNTSPDKCRSCDGRGVIWSE